MPISNKKIVAGTSLLAATATTLALLLGGEGETPKPMDIRASLSKLEIYRQEAPRHRARPSFGFFSGKTKSVETKFEDFSITHVFSRKETAEWDSLADGLEKVIYEDSDSIIEEVSEDGRIMVNGVVVWDRPKRVTLKISNKRR